MFYELCASLYPLLGPWACGLTLSQIFGKALLVPAGQTRV